jgi:lysozyme family protein
VRIDEGGNDDDPHDHGGRTSRGITQREYDAWCHERGKSTCDVWHAPDADIDAIYHGEYWNPWCDGLPIGTDYIFFDMSVNSGPHEATVLLQRALGVADDGRMGPITRNALAAAYQKKLITGFSSEKRVFYRRISMKPGQRKFLQGWLNRTDAVERRALTLLS